MLGLPKKKLPIIKKAIQIYNATPQTDQAEAGWTLGEMVMDERQQDARRRAGRERRPAPRAWTCSTTMDQREATVLRMRFGLDDHEPRTLKEIGEQLGLTRERVRQIETEALNKMADSMEDPPRAWLARRRRAPLANSVAGLATAHSAERFRPSLLRKALRSGRTWQFASA